VKDGRDDGAEYRFDSRVTGPVMEGGDIVGVKYTGPGGARETVRGDIVIDATGPSAPLAKELGVSTLRRERQAVGLEYELEGIDVDHEGYADLSDAMMLRLDHDIAPGGYSWIFHTGADTAKVGVCFIQNDRHKEHAKEDFSIDDYIDYWMENDPRFAEASRIEGVHHRGSAHIQPPGKLSTDNFMAIGDTVPTVDPMWGEGIHAGMQSARAAAITADGVLTPAARDTSAVEMGTYDKLWHTEVAPRIRQRLLMTELMYYAPNDRYDRFLSDLDSLDMDTLRRANKGKKRALVSLFHMRDIPMLTGFLREQLGVKFTQWRRGTLRP
jgi:digeranylgeranylglycerophospholipid reductase